MSGYNHSYHSSINCMVFITFFIDEIDFFFKGINNSFHALTLVNGLTLVVRRCQSLYLFEAFPMSSVVGYG